MQTSQLHKFIIRLSFLGANFSGWQIQNNAPTIQGEIMKGLHYFLDRKSPLIVGAGRTDAGVHAINFFAHFEFYNQYLDTNNLLYNLNRFLPDNIVIHSIKLVSSDFHARFSAISRKYEYLVSTKKDPFLINRAFYFYKELDLELMNLASNMLLGHKNCSSFSKSNYDNSICNIQSAYWFKSKNMLIFSIESNRFLYNMVRCIVGTLIDVGLKKINLEDFTNIIESNNRSNAGFSVPAYGLYLSDVKYPKKYIL
ncbi:MAG: tRNA pseudouridine(38-40) synthase TruA [Flavobacteriales bacterium]|nr:tRNA pseudouridine(38-40) synthase TruA [Flavobacteriales bacterium]